jgi:uncharacterized membrane protein (UPF0182 family)
VTHPSYAREPIGVWQVRIGRALSTIAVLFLLFDSSGKLLKVAPVVAGTAELGYPESVIRTLGVILLLCVVTYLVPRFSIVGAVLLTGYFGGAVATHVRVGSPLLTHVLFPIYLAVFVWLGLWLRDARLHGLFVARA